MLMNDICQKSLKWHTRIQGHLLQNSNILITQLDVDAVGASEGIQGKPVWQILKQRQTDFTSQLQVCSQLIETQSTHHQTPLFTIPFRYEQS